MATTLVKEAIKNELIINPLADRTKLARKFSVTRHEIGAIDAAMKRMGKAKDKLSKAMDSLTNTYANSNGENKATARAIMIDWVKKSNVKGLVLTLPFITWIIEKAISKFSPDMVFLGVERDEQTAKSVKAECKRLKATGEINENCNTYHGNINEKIYGSIRDTYAHLILDYCGVLSSIKNELKYAIQSKIVQKGGIIAVTFFKRRDGDIIKETNIDYVTNISENKDNRCATEKAIEAFFQNVRGEDFEIKQIYYYNDSSPMVLVILQRIV